MRLLSFLGIALFLTSCSETRSHLPIDSAIEAELRQVKAIDNHAHPMRILGPGEVDHDFDALPAEALEDVTLPPPSRPDSPYFVTAWKNLFGYQFADSKPEHLRTLEQAKANVARQKGDSYPVWVLNQTNTELMLANRVAMGRGLPNDRFKWVPFVDMFLLPLNNDSIKAKDPDHKAFVGAEELLLKRYMTNSGMQSLPGSFDDYLTFVTHMLENWKASGAVALKFEFAYLRDLNITSQPKESASRVYAIYARSSEPTPDEYKILQDFVFRYISQEAGRLGLAIHIHCALGVGSYFHMSNANPMALEPLFNDPALRKTKFVIIHGGWPYVREAAALIQKPNVYLDFSLQNYFTYPTEIARSIRLYLESAPEKVLYASDASPFGGDIGWEETTWLGTTNGKQALGLALTGMLEDGEITRERAKELVHMVMRENARQLYRF